MGVGVHEALHLFWFLLLLGLLGLVVVVFIGVLEGGVVFFIFVILDLRFDRLLRFRFRQFGITINDRDDRSP